MVLERMISVGEALRNPLHVFFASGIISVICLAVSILIFPENPGLFTTFWITFSMFPFTLSLLIREEAEEEEVITKGKKTNILQRRKDVLLLYTAFFCGVVLSYSILFLILPSSVSENIFREQIEEIKLIRGYFFFKDKLLSIVLNNFSVLTLCFLLSILFGVGAIFILTWNATILAAAIGMVAKSLGGMMALPYSVLIFLPHGSLEILAYFIGGISGGIISITLSKRRSKLLFPIIVDSLIFLFMAYALIIVAAFIEIFLMII
jgi:uncharacterized membrane protein SpoIIM required for sporulation